MAESSQSIAISRFIEEMGLISQNGGGPRIAGRILGLVIVEGRELSLHEMAERLNISRASASTNARLLANRGVLRLVAHPGDRQDYYAIVPGLESKVFQQIATEMRQNAVTIGECAKELSSFSAEMGERVSDLAQFYNKSASFLDDWLIKINVDDPKLTKI